MEYWHANSSHYSETPSLQLCLSNADAAFALFKKRAQRRQIISAGLQRDGINVVPPKGPRKLCFESSDEICKKSSRLAISRVDLDLFACFGILQGNDADIWQRSFAFILNLNRYEIVPPPLTANAREKSGA